MAKVTSEQKAVLEQVAAFVEKTLETKNLIVRTKLNDLVAKKFRKDIEVTGLDQHDGRLQKWRVQLDFILCRMMESHGVRLQKGYLICLGKVGNILGVELTGFDSAMKVIDALIGQMDRQEDELSKLTAKKAFASV